METSFGRDLVFFLLQSLHLISKNDVIWFSFTVKLDRFKTGYLVIVGQWKLLFDFLKKDFYFFK